jgi:type VI secretion system ImpC/EvpB family protein
VVDHEVRRRPGSGTPTDDVNVLAGVAAAAFAPTVVAASPAVLQVDAFADLALAGDLAPPFRGAEYARCRGLAPREDMRFLAEGFRHEEDAAGLDERVWITAGYAFAAAVGRAFATYSWSADVRGCEAGGLVAGAPAEPFASDAAWPRPTLDIVLTDRQERALTGAGLMPLSALPFGTQAVFAAVCSLQAPARMTGATGAANVNSRLSAHINTMLCVSRFAHYIMLMDRAMAGAFRTPEEIEQRLHIWLQGYVNSNPSAGASRARHPLVAAEVTVRERPGHPGVFGCTVLLQPHFQLDDVSATFRLVTEIVTPGKA